MTSERAQAYGRVMNALSDLSHSKFHPDEQELIREAADVLLFTESETAEARGAVREVRSLLDKLVGMERLTPETAARLLADVERCGPLVPA